MIDRLKAAPALLCLALLGGCGGILGSGSSSDAVQDGTDDGGSTLALMDADGIRTGSGGSSVPAGSAATSGVPGTTNGYGSPTIPVEWTDGQPDPMPIPDGARVIHVDPAGNDAHDGSSATTAGSSGAVRTLERARQLVRASASNWPRGGFVVSLAPGRYELRDALRLDAGDSGRADAPVRYRGTTIDGRRASQVVGSVRLANVGRTPVDGQAGLVRLDAGTSLNARSAVIVGRTALTEARWPNEGFSTISASQGGTVRLAGELPAASAQTPVTLHGFAHEDWLFELLAARGTGASGTVQLADAGKSVRIGARAFASGSPSYLDLAGEYVVEPAKSAVIVQSAIANDPSIEVSVLANLVVADGLRHVLFEGLSICNSTANALELRNVDSVVLDNVEVCNTGGWAVNIWGRASGVRDSHLRRLGAGGVYMFGGDRASLTAGNMFVEASVIEDFGRIERSYTPAVRTEGVGGRVAGNIIRHAAHVGLMFGGNDQQMLFNDISDVVREAGDMGAIYVGRNWTTRGHVIRGNRIYDIQGPGHGAGRGIYLDDQFSSALIEGNLIANARNGIFVGGGRHNTIRGNVFFASEPSIFFDARGLDDARLSAGNRPQLEAALAAMPYTSSVWAARYPELARIRSEDPMAPIGNQIHGNLFVDGSPIQLYGPSAATYMSAAVGTGVQTAGGAGRWQGMPGRDWFAAIRGQAPSADSLFPWNEFDAARARALLAIRPL